MEQYAPKFQQTTQHIPEDSNLHTDHHEQFKSHMVLRAHNNCWLLMLESIWRQYEYHFREWYCPCLQVKGRCTYPVGFFDRNNHYHLSTKQRSSSSLVQKGNRNIGERQAIVFQWSESRIMLQAQQNRHLIPKTSRIWFIQKKTCPQKIILWYRILIIGNIEW
jgi:hypothetical protein